MPAQARVHATLAISAVLTIWAVVLTMFMITRTPIVAVAGAIDLTCTAGLTMYFFAVRRGHLPHFVLTLTIAAGVIGARTLLSRVDDATNILIAAAIAFELGALVLVLARLGRARRAWRAARAAKTGDALDAALAATGLPVVVRRVLASELHVMANVVAGWRAPRRDANIFTSHRANGWALIAGTLIALTLVETPLVHLVLTAFGHSTIAWIATALSLYSVAWLIGDLHALRHGGIVVTADALELRLGVRWRGRIPWTAVASVARCTEAPTKHVDVSILGANTLLTLTGPHEIRGLFGRRRDLGALALSVDEPERFAQTLRSILSASR